MELEKYTTASSIRNKIIGHDMRLLDSYGNEDIDLSLSNQNYSLIDRGKTIDEINNYRKQFEKECFKYNRKNLVHAVQLCIQCPTDCPPEQEKEFFQTAFDWYCNNYLPAGKDCVFVAEVHCDEHKYITSIENGIQVKKDISKHHLHIAYTPAVPAGEKHPDFKYRLCADALTKKKILREMHPSLQKELDEKGIKATVYQKKSGDDGKPISKVPLSVSQLKAITDKTGIVIDHTLSVDELAQILSKNVELEKEVEQLSTEVKQTTNIISLLHEKEAQIEALQKELVSKDKQIDLVANEKNAMQKELEEVKEENKKLEMQQSVTTDKEKTWGADASWGATSSWGNTTNKEHIVEEEKLV